MKRAVEEAIKVQRMSRLVIMLERDMNEMLGYS